MRRSTVFPQMPLPSRKSATVGSLQHGYLHFARAFLLALGFLFHAAWLCTDGNDVFKSGMDVIHGFRMEGFFVIAGLLSAHSLRRVPSSRFLLRRTERLGIPLLFFSLIFGMFGSLIRHLDCARSIASARIHFGDQLCPRLDFAGHLWFLRILLLFALALSLLHFVWRRIDEHVVRLRTSPFLLLLALVSMRFLALHWTRVLPPEILQFPSIVDDLERAIRYAPWLITGYFLFHQDEIMDTLVNSVAFNVSNVAAFLLLAPRLDQPGIGHYVSQLWQGAYIVSTCGVLFWSARRVFSNPSACVRSLSEASYTMYLLHWPIMALLFVLPFFRAVPKFLLFADLVVVAAILSYGIHLLLVRRSHLWAWLFNGVPMPAGQPWAQLRPLAAFLKSPIPRCPPDS